MDRDSWILALGASKTYTDQISTTNISNVDVVEYGGNTYLRCTYADGSGDVDLQLNGLMTSDQQSWVKKYSKEILFNPTTKQLEYKGVSIENVFVDIKANFPAIGNKNVIYINSKDNSMYRWDDTNNKYIELSSGSSGNSDKMNRTDPTVITVGGIQAGSIVDGKTSIELWEEALFPYQKPTVAIALNPNKTLYEKGVDTINSITISVTVTKKSANITDVEIYDGSTLIATLPVNLTSGSKTVSYTYSCNITTDTTFKAIAKDGKQNGEATAKIEFINPMYRGLLGSGTTKVMQKKGAYTYNNITCTNDAVVFKYDSSYGNLTSIIDANNFENINSFTKSTETINGVTYNVYTSGLATLNNFSYTFKF